MRNEDLLAFYLLEGRMFESCSRLSAYLCRPSNTPKTFDILSRLTLICFEGEKMNRAYYQDPVSSFASKDSRIILAELAQTTVANINVHIRNIFTEGELEPEAVIKDFSITATDGKNYLNQDELDILNRKAGKDLRDHTTSCARPGFPSKSRPSEEEQAGQIETEF